MSKATEMLQEAGYVTDEVLAPYCFKVGDVVQLKSGGPLMTVTRAQSFFISVSYFDTEHRLFDSSFPWEALKKKLSAEKAE